MPARWLEHMPSIIIHYRSGSLVSSHPEFNYGGACARSARLQTKSSIPARTAPSVIRPLSVMSLPTNIDTATPDSRLMRIDGWLGSCVHTCGAGCVFGLYALLNVCIFRSMYVQQTLAEPQVLKVMLSARTLNVLPLIMIIQNCPSAFYVIQPQQMEKGNQGRNILFPSIACYVLTAHA